MADVVGGQARAVSLSVWPKPVGLGGSEWPEDQCRTLSSVLFEPQNFSRAAALEAFLLGEENALIPLTAAGHILIMRTSQGALRRKKKQTTGRSHYLYIQLPPRVVLKSWLKLKKALKVSRE